MTPTKRFATEVLLIIATTALATGVWWLIIQWIEAP